MKLTTSDYAMKTILTWAISGISILSVSQLFASGITVNAGSDTVVCDINTAPLHANDLASGQSGVWRVVGGAGVFADSTDPKTLVTGYTAGDNHYEWEVSVYDTVSSFSLDHNGFGDHLAIPHDGSLDFPTELTLECWVKLDDAADNQKVIGKTTAAFNGGYMLGIDNNTLYPEFWDEFGVNHTFQSGNISSNTWTHLAVSWETGGDMIGYIDGVEVNRIAASANNLGANTSDLIIGAAPWDPSFFGVVGLIDEIRIWKKAIPEADLSQWKNKTLDSSHPHYSDLVSYYQMNAGNGTTFTDSISNNNGTITGSLWDPENAPISSGSGPICVESDTVKLSYGNSPVVTLDPIDPVCLNTPAFNLSGGSPADGSFSGTGVSNNTFDPVAAGTGAYTISYTVTDSIGCMGSASRLLRVDSTPPKPQIIRLGGDTLHCDVSGDSYTWFLDGSPTGDQTQSITGSQSGHYTVVVSLGNCDSDESNPLAPVGIGQPGQTPWSLYPNPAKDYCILDFRGTKKISVSLLSLAGQVVLQEQFHTGQVRLDVKGLNRGLYLLRIDDGSLSYKKLVLM